MRIWLVVVVLLSACGGGPSCKEAVGKVAKRFGTEGRPEVTMMIGRCEQDDWSGGLRACFAEAETADKLEACIPAPDYASVMPPAEPSDATKQLARKAGPVPIKALLFFDAKNEVGAFVRRYFEHLGFTIEQHDRLTEPELARQYKIYKDGTIALVHGDRIRTLDVHPDVERALVSGELARFDREVNTQVERLVRQLERVYLVAGHGEITDPDSRSTVGGVVPERRTESLRRRLIELGVQVVTLQRDQLAKQVPTDAAVVVWLGPVIEPSADEWAALGRYVDAGGRLLVALDPTSPVGLGPLEEKLGVRFVAEHVLDDKLYLKQRNTPSDHALLVTNKFLAHASTATLSRAVDKGIVFVDPGRLERLPSPAAGLKVTSTIQTRDSSFVDKNGNYELDGDEKRGVLDLAVAVERDKMRATVFADVDLFADAMINDGTGRIQVTLTSGPLLDDSMRWLAGLADIAPAPADKADPPAKPDRHALDEIERRQALRAAARRISSPE